MENNSQFQDKSEDLPIKETLSKLFYINSKEEFIGLKEINDEITTFYNQLVFDNELTNLYSTLNFLFNTFNSSPIVLLSLTPLNYPQKIYNAFIDCYLTIITKETNDEIKRIKQKLLDILSIISQYIECPIEAFEYIYQKLSLLTLKKHLALEVTPFPFNNETFKSYLELLFTLYKCNIQDKCIKKIPSNCIISNKKKLNIKLNNNESFSFKNGFYIFGWIYIKDSFVDDGKKYLFYFETDNKSTIEVFFQKNKNEIFLSYNSADENQVYEESSPFPKDLENEWMLFTFQVDCRKSNYKLIFQIFNLIVFEKPSMSEIVLKMNKFTSQNISNINFYDNLDCIFSSIIIGKNININKMIQKEKSKLLYYGIHNQKTYKMFCDSFMDKKESFHAIYLPFKVNFNAETMTIKIQEINQGLDGYLSNIKSYKINDMDFQDSFIYTFNDMTKRIHLIGGINALLPLFEILFTQNDLFEASIDLFEYLFSMMTQLLIKTQHNFTNAILTDFFQGLSLFLENIPKKYFTSNISKCLIDIKDYYLSNLQFFDEFFNGEKIIYNVYFEHIFFNERILFRFPKDLIKAFWGQILIIVKDVCHYHLHLSQDSGYYSKSRTSTSESFKRKNLEYEHLNYFFNYKKFVSILLYYETKTSKKFCCEKHSSLYEINDKDNNNNSQKKDGFLQPDLASILEPMESVLNNLIIVDLFHKHSKLLDIFKLIPLNISPCIRNFLISVLSQINTHRFSFDNNDFLIKFKERNLVNYLIVALGNTVFAEKAIILSTIVSLDKESFRESLLSKPKILPLIKFLIPNDEVKEETNSKFTFNSLAETFDKTSYFIKQFEEYRKTEVLYCYNFRQWVQQNCPKYKSSSKDELSKNAIIIYTVIFDWLKFWIYQSLNVLPDKTEIISEKTNALFELLNQFVIRIRQINLLKEHLIALETLFMAKTLPGDSKCLYGLINSKTFWFYLFENYYLCYRITKEKNETTFRGGNHLFKSETSKEEMIGTLEEISSKCIKIIREMGKILLSKDIKKTILYYLLTWGSYQKILYKSIEETEKSSKSSNPMIYDCIKTILDLYLDLIKECKPKKEKFKPNYYEFTGIVINLIYDFSILFPENTLIASDLYGILEVQFLSIFYLPAFLLSQTKRITEFSNYLRDITFFLMDFFDVQALYGKENELKLKNCKPEEKQGILDNIVEQYIYNKNYSEIFLGKLHFLSLPESKKFILSNQSSLPYLSVPIMKIILHFLCCLSLATNDELLYLTSIEFFLINVIIMSTAQNNKHKKGTTTQNPMLKEINKLIEPFLILGFTFLLDQSKKTIEPIKSIIYLSKKILTHKNSSQITQSPIYNVFANIIKTSDKHSLLNYLKQETHNFSFDEMGDKFINSKTNRFWINLIYKNENVLECIKEYFGKEEILKHIIRIHCEIKDIIPIYNHVNINKIQARSDATNYNLETNEDLAFSENQMETESTLSTELNKIIQKQIDNFKKINRCIYLKEQYIKNIYKNIKQQLFSWRGVWSDKNVFYKQPECLKLKFLYHLSKDFTTPLLTPILDIDLYLPTFRAFNKKILFLQDYDKATHYGISLNIDKVITLIKRKNQPESENIKNNHINSMMQKLNIPILNSNSLDNKYIKACMVKQTHHLSGHFHISKTHLMFEYEYYEEGTGIESNHLLFDKDNKTCFGSFFKTYTKDRFKSYLKIPLESITMLMKRNYYYCHNSIEIFTENNKSYFFHFANNAQRKIIFEQLKQTQDFKVLKSQNKKENDELFYITSKFQENMNLTVNTFTEYIKLWEIGQISNFSFIMMCNFLAGRSLRDLTQYPVFPWTFINYFAKELCYQPSIFRSFSTPIGMLDFSPESKKRKDQFLKEFRIMESEKNNENENDNSDDEENEQTDMGTNFSELCSKGENVSLQKFQNIPYHYGTHYTNPLYVSHYLSRIFPFSQVRIEFQGDNFDPTRLFLSVEKTFHSATTQKSDVRELIPEFFFLPELFINVNQLNFSDETKSTFDVKLPDWSHNKPHIFVKEMRKSLEYQENNEENGINKWLNLIIGINRRGNNAKAAGNLYMFHTYSSVFSLDKFESRDDIDKKTLSLIDYYFRMSELGLSANLLINEELPNREKNFKKSIVLLNEINSAEKQIKKINDFFKKYSFRYLGLIQKKVIYALTTDNQLFTIPLSIFTLLSTKKINKETFTLHSNEKFQYLKKEPDAIPYSIDFPFFISKNAIIHASFWNGTLFLENKSNSTVDILINEYDKSQITVIACDQNEDFGFCGTLKGSILVYTIKHIKKQTEETKDFKKFLHKKKKDSTYNVEWIFKTCLNNHTKAVSAITINHNLNVVGSSAKDGYINLYTIPTLKLFRSVKLCSITYSDYLFISHCPIPCFVVFNEGTFLSYTINGSEIEVDTSFPSGNKYNENLLKEKHISSYYIFTEKSTSIQYLLIGTDTGFIQLREFPEMKLIKYEKIFNNSPVIALISLNDLNNEFLFFTSSENEGTKFKTTQIQNKFHF